MFLKIKEIMKNTSKTVRILLFAIYDVLAVCFAEYLALLTRFDFDIEQINIRYVENAGRYLGLNIVITLVIFMCAKMYSSLWRYASVQEMINIVAACATAYDNASFLLCVIFLFFTRTYWA